MGVTLLVPKSKTQAKPKKAGKQKLDPEVTALVDRMSDLTEQIDQQSLAMKPLVLERTHVEEQLRKLLKGQFAAAHEDAEVTVKGEKALMIAKPANNVTTVDVKATQELLGEDRFRDVVTVALGKLKALLSPLELAKVAQVSRGTKRAIKIVRL